MFVADLVTYWTSIRCSREFFAIKSMKFFEMQLYKLTIYYTACPRWFTVHLQSVTEVHSDQVP